MTKEERAQLMTTDYQAYADLVPDGHWLQLLDAIARSGINDDQKGSQEQA